jgi:hypothetical protein
MEKDFFFLIEVSGSRFDRSGLLRSSAVFLAGQGSSGLDFGVGTGARQRAAPFSSISFVSLLSGVARSAECARDLLLSRPVRYRAGYGFVFLCVSC